jgi:cellulose synthase/poly-beta-1,6-N-acetylglucosamine synthase-like glycosyltransferase/peptidoglycan/xylan/chitin deacetylase (PgdA/CDA1 family)
MWGRRLLLGLGIGMVVLMLLVDGITTKTVGASSTGGPSAGVSPLAGERPVLVYNGHGGLVSHQPAPGRRIALTFDDGPSPEWTPKIAAILMAEHVPATFFEVGSQVVRHPELTSMLHRDGFQLGNHTFTHADLSQLPRWEARLQVSLTESAIAGITGIRPRLLRPPYSSTTSAATPVQARAWTALAASGHMIALANYDTEDWRRPGVARILANILSQPSIRHGVGGIVLMHDAGGDRSQTVAALPKLIAALRARGFRFVTVSEIAGIPASQAQVPASAAQRLRGRAFEVMLALAGIVTSILTWLVMGVTVTVGVRMLAALTLARAHRRRVRSLRFDPSFAPAVSVVVPAYNEALGIERSLRSLVGSRYPGRMELIVVDDGSTDETATIVEQLIREHRGPAELRLLRQPNAGKAAALNRALTASRYEIIVTVDADTVFEPDTIALLVQRFSDRRVGAVSGNTKVGNRRGLIGRWQHIEYVMGFNLDRRAYEVLGSTPTVPGAIGAFRRQALAQIGGVSGATLAEDTDITLDIGRAGWLVVYESRARGWTEAPTTLRAFYRQRSRWAYGTIQSMWKHRRVLVAANQGSARAVVTLIVFQMLLPLCAPLIDLFAIYGLIFLQPLPIVAFWGAFNLFQMALAIVAFRLDGEPMGPLWALPLQQFLHRQVSYLVVYDAVITALLGGALHWQHSQRTGHIQVIGGELERQAVEADQAGALEHQPAGAIRA